jgi:hypothetical protein
MLQSFTSRNDRANGNRRCLLEYRLPQGYIADVVLVANSKVKMVVEIKVTHTVEK